MSFVVVAVVDRHPCVTHHKYTTPGVCSQCHSYQTGLFILSNLTNKHL